MDNDNNGIDLSGLGGTTPKTGTVNQPTGDHNNPGGNNGSTTQTKQRGNSLLFGDMIGTQISGIGGIANSVRETINKIYVDELQDATLRPKVLLIDNNTVDRIRYSTVVVALLMDNILYYHTIVITATADKPKSARQIMDKVEANRGNRSGRGGDYNLGIFTTDDVVDDILQSHVFKAIKDNFRDVNNNTELVSASAIYIPHDMDPQDGAVVAAKIAYISIQSQYMMTGRGMLDLNITEALEDINSRNPDSNLKSIVDYSMGTTTDVFGRPVRADFVIDHAVVDKSTRWTSPNEVNTQKVLSTVTGMVDLIPNSSVPYGAGFNGQQQAYVTRLNPHIILTSVKASAPTLCSGLLSMISSLIMIKPEMYLPALIGPKKGAVRDVGSLNILTNINNETDKNGYGTPIDLVSNDLSDDDKYTLIRNMIVDEPMMSIDIEAFGPESNYMGVLARAVSPKRDVDSLNDIDDARGEIIDALHRLTDGHFPKDYDRRKIFTGTGIQIPIGIWSNNKAGDRDVRDLDLCMVATHTKDPELIKSFAMSVGSTTLGDADSFIKRVDGISETLSNGTALITGKVVRAMYHSELISTVLAAATAAGLDPEFNSVIALQNGSNLSMLNPIITAGAIVNAGTLGHHEMGKINNTGYGLSMQYTPVGRRNW